MIWTNPLHHLWRGTSYLDTTSAPFTITVHDYGPWVYTIHAPASFIVFAVSLVILIRQLLSAQKPYRRQSIVLLFSIALPLATALLYAIGLTPISHFDLTPFMFGIAGLIIGWNLINFKFLNLTPFSRDTIVEIMAEIVLVLDDKGCIVDHNRAALTLAPDNTSSLAGRTITQLLPDHHQLINQKADDTKSQFYATIHDRHYDVRLSTLFRRNGTLRGNLIVMRDITPRKVAQDALKAAHDRLAVLLRFEKEIERRLDLSYVLNIAIDSAVRLSRADAGIIGLVKNDQMRIAKSVGGYSKSVPDDYRLNTGIAARVARQLQPECVLDVQADPDYICFLEETQAQITIPLRTPKRLVGLLVLETRNPDRFTTDVFETVRLLGTSIATSVENSQLYEELGTYAHSLEQTIDERDALIRDLDAFAHTVAHDLKSPLTVLTGYSDLLLSESDSLTKEEHDTFVGHISDYSLKMAKIIDELLLLAGVRKEIKVNTGPLDMGAIVAEARKRVVTLQERVQATLIGPDTWPVAHGYGPWVEEVWANYLSNALKYGGSPAHITLGASIIEDDKMIRFWVRDQGPGIAADKQDSLFSEFSQLQKTRASGHGLGLSIVKRIIERLGGSVGVESAEGAGSTFYFTLPEHTES